MKESTARKLMIEISKMESPFDEFGNITLEIENEEERLAMRLAISKIMGDAFTELMIPIVRQYPNLDPDKEGKDWYKSIRNNSGSNN